VPEGSLAVFCAIVGGWLFQALGLSIGASAIGAFVPALIGAGAILLVVKAIKRA
jgi:uncharacterized membrane protein YeaQ/YmgE (transglycosylase-associated protein family)